MEKENAVAASGHRKPGTWPTSFALPYTRRCFEQKFSWVTPRLMLAPLVDVEVVAARLPLGTTDAWACVATVLMKRPMAPP